MRWLKKVLRIIAILLPCFCCLALPHNTFAKSFVINTIPIAYPNKTLYDPFHITFSQLTYTAPKTWYIQYVLQDNKCTYDDFHDSTASTSTALQMGFSYVFDSSEALYPCKHLARISNSFYNESSLPNYVLGRPNFRSWDQYWYAYDGLYLFDYDTNNGLNRQSKLNFSDLFKTNDNPLTYSIPESMTLNTLPIGLLFPTQDTISAGSSIIVKGEYWVDGDSTTPASYGGTHSILVRGFLDSIRYANDSPSSFTINCSDRVYLDNGINFREFYCSGTSPYTFDTHYPVGLTFRSSPGQDSYSWYMENANKFVIDSFNVITNNDTTDGGLLNPSVSGGETINAPGNINSQLYHPGVESADYYQSLVDQFNFSFTNPFQPIFDLFTNGDACTQIPILAGMLNSTETEYCPWFDANTRNIVTPVVALSSVMLVFGFLVRWLGASSGNLFEDGGSGGGSMGKSTFIGKRGPNA